jgi:hypothetical protein
MSTRANTSLPLGQIVATANALAEISQADIDAALRRHATGDWGDLCAEDKETNDQALVEGMRILSVYRAANGTKFWIITEANRSTTNVELHISHVMLSLQKC